MFLLMMETKSCVIFLSFIMCFAYSMARYNKVNRNVKYILYWRPDYLLRFTAIGPLDKHREYSAKTLFIKKKCAVNNCYLTQNKDFFPGYPDFSKFHAIIFHIPQADKLPRAAYPQRKHPHQKFIYASTESAQNFPVCTVDFNRYFDWTFTHRLDSDIVYKHVTVRDMEGNFVSPKQNVLWKKKMKNIDLSRKFKTKTKMAAWFPAHCTTKSKRENLVKELDDVLREYGYNIDTYGECGNATCSVLNRPRWYPRMSRDYYFYLAFEDSFSMDYVTAEAVNGNYDEKFYMVPIVFGAANYSKFLPPGSYINAAMLSPELLALKMMKLVKDHKKYSRYFRWKNYYKMYTKESGLKGYDDGVCDLCRLLNDRRIYRNNKVIDDFRKWWNPYYKDECLEKLRRDF